MVAWDDTFAKSAILSYMCVNMDYLQIVPLLTQGNFWWDKESHAATDVTL
jgi:hypothetical protein